QIITVKKPFLWSPSRAAPLLSTPPSLDYRVRATGHFKTNAQLAKMYARDPEETTPTSAPSSQEDQLNTDSTLTVRE
ncbi:uncharacterized, partial [Tachysurus ichikawai]